MQQQNLTLEKQNVVKLNLPMKKDAIFKKQYAKYQYTSEKESKNY